MKKDSALIKIVSDAYKAGHRDAKGGGGWSNGRTAGKSGSKGGGWSNSRSKSGGKSGGRKSGGSRGGSGIPGLK